MNRHFPLLQASLVAALCIACPEPAQAAAGGQPIPPLTWPAHDMNRPAPRIVKPGASFSELAPPPADAIVLFDGKDLSRFEGPGTGPTPEQLAFMRIEQPLTNLTAAASAARQSLVAASFTEKPNLSALTESIRAAELALATARADAFARLQATSDRLDATQTRTLTQQAIRGGARAGREIGRAHV